MRFIEWLQLKEDIIKVNDVSQLGSIEKIVPTTSPNIYWVKTKERVQPFQADLGNINPEAQKRIIAQFKPQKQLAQVPQSEQPGWILLYRGVRGRFRFITPQELDLRDKLNAAVEKHHQQHGAVGLQQWKYWKKYQELNRLDKEQEFSDQKNDAIDYAERSPVGGQVVTIYIPRQELKTPGIEFGSPILRGQGGGGQTTKIPANILKGLMQKYPHKIETIPPK